MAGRRLLDVAALFNASRGIVRQHIALRQQQFDVFTRTSSLAKAVKSQAERYTETAKAASFLASRMNEDKPSWTYEATESTEAERTPKDAPIPSASTVETEASQAANFPKEGISQDHFYEKSASNSSTDPAPKDALPVRQEKADRYPLPDGTIPPSGSNIEKEPLVQNQKFATLGGLPTQSSAESTIPVPHHPDYTLTPDEARLLQREYEKQIPSCPVDGKEGHTRDSIVKGFDDDSFYHPSEHTSPVLSTLPRIKVPKHVNSVQANDPHVASTDINSDSYSSAVQTTTSPKQEADPLTGEEDVPQGVNTAIFSSARIARSLGGRTHSSPGSISNQKPSRTAPEQASSAIASAKSQQSHASSVETEPAEKEVNINVRTPNVSIYPGQTQDQARELIADSSVVDNCGCRYV